MLFLQVFSLILSVLWTPCPWPLALQRAARVDMAMIMAADADPSNLAADACVGDAAAAKSWQAFLSASLACGAGAMDAGNPKAWICARGCMHKGAPAHITCGRNGTDSDPVWKHMMRNEKHFSAVDNSCDAALCFPKKWAKVVTPPNEAQQDKIISAWLTRVIHTPCLSQ